MIQFNSIADLLRSAKTNREPVQKDFDIFLFDELDAEVRKMMPPHRRNFYTIIFMKDQKDGQIHINQNTHTQLNNTLLFQGKEHIFSFVRDASVKGGVVMFHQSFLLPFIKNMEAAFPFFNVSNQNHYPLNDKEQILFEQLFSVLLQESVNVSVVKPILLAFLEKSKLLYGTYGKEEQFLSKKSLLVRKFKNLISNHFIDKKEVSFYASQLTISANYLNEVVKSETGFSAKSHISNRVLLEAKNLLLYSEMDIAEISHVLQFSEPTHFTKFFKKGTGQTPKSFQNQKR